MHVCPMVTPGLPPIPHVGGPVAMGCPTVLIGGLPAARVGDITTCVGPPDPIAMGSPTVIIGGMPAARVGDLTTHGGTIVVGCPSVLIGDAGGGGGGAGGGAGGGGGGGAAAAPPSQVVAAYQSGVGANIAPVSPEQVGPLQPNKEKKEKTWIGIILKDFEGLPIPNQDFQITLDSGQLLRGCTDAKGYARFENIEPDSGNVAFIQLTEIKDTPVVQSGRTAEAIAAARSPDFDSIPLSKSETIQSSPGTDTSDEEFDTGGEEDELE